MGPKDVAASGPGRAAQLVQGWQDHLARGLPATGTAGDSQDVVYVDPAPERVELLDPAGKRRHVKTEEMLERLQCSHPPDDDWQRRQHRTLVQGGSPLPIKQFFVRGCLGGVVLTR